MTLVKVSMSAYKVTDLFCISTLNFFFKLINHSKEITDLIFGCYMKRQSNLCRENIRKQECGICENDQVVH